MQVPEDLYYTSDQHSPYQDSWLVELEIEGAFEVDGLLDSAAYRDLTE